MKGGLINLSEDVQLAATQDIGQKTYPDCLASLTKIYQM